MSFIKTVFKTKCMQIFYKFGMGFVSKNFTGQKIIYVYIHGMLLNYR